MSGPISKCPDTVILTSGPAPIRLGALGFPNWRCEMDYANIFCHLPIALPIGTNFLTEQNHKIERISDLVVVIKKLTKTTEDATFRRMTK